ncbi:MAG: 50S ribosomal protein L21 [Bacilli bacterium]|jgi:large subunit ribosomal protein L21
MYAIIETGGKQIKVVPGESVMVEKIEATVGEEVIFDKVLLVCDKKAKIGTPYLKGVKVKAKVEKQDKNKKIVVFKFKAKSNYRIKTGHRQPYTKVLIEEIITA